VENFLKIWRFFLRLFLHPIYFLSYLSLRDKNIWVFGSGDGERFADNSKYLFLYTAKTKENNAKRAIWISKDKTVIKKLRKKNYETYYNTSIKGIYYLLRAKYFITDTSSFALNYWLSGGAKIINLWHGIPLKKISYDARKGKGSKCYHSRGIVKLLHKFNTPWLFEKYFKIITTSSKLENIFTSALKSNKKNISITGYPRNDIFFNWIKDCDLGINKLILNNIKKNKEKNKIIFYLPTFRDTGGNPFEEAEIDLDKFNQFLISHNLIFIAKFHPLSKINNFNADEYKNILILPSETDIYPILKFTDLLITDYSSVYFDFLLSNKPILFFPYDLNKYLSKDRELYFDYNKFTPGQKSYDFKNLLGGIENILIKQKDEYKNERSKIKEFCYKYKDGKSAERIFNLLNNL
jgi:CDP-glycerol glycerophosphotransferase (TagB/SpsB family)